MASGLISCLKNKNISLRTWLAISMIVAFSAVIISYSLLATHFLFQGMKEFVSYNIKNIAFNENSSKIYHISDSWQKQPKELRNLMPSEPYYSNQLYHIKIPEHNNTEKVSSWIVYKFKNDLKTRYVSFINHPESDLSNYRLLAPTRVAFLLISTAAILLLFMFLILWFTFKTMGKPISNLKDWANSLTVNDLDKPIPNFVYPELNGFAKLLYRNMQAISQTSQRERKFLAYTSHELRTPLSIILSNTEIIKYLINSLENNNINNKLKEAVTRLERSTHQMQRVCQAILWLDRGSDSIMLEPVKLDELIHEVIQQNINNISNNQQIQLDTKLQANEISTYRFPLQIVLNNMIKNAFQHTLMGNITIRLTKNYIEVENNLTASKDGFGVGLELTRKLAKKLGFEYIVQKKIDTFYCKLVFNNTNLIDVID